MRKIAIPLKNDILCNHFGHSDEFAIFETENGSIKKEEKLTPPPHEPGTIPRWLRDEGVTDVIAGGIGQRAIQILLENKMNVFVGVAPKHPEALVKDLLADCLQAGVNLCDH